MQTEPLGIELPTVVTDLLNQVISWFQTDFLTVNTLYQTAAILLAAVIGHFAHMQLSRFLNWAKDEWAPAEKVAMVVDPVCWPLMALTFTELFQFGFQQLDLSSYLLDIAGSLLMAWVVIRAAVTLIKSVALQKIVAYVAWTIAALDIIGWREPLVAYLDQTQIAMGAADLTVLDVLVGIIYFIVFIWGALLAGRLFEGRVDKLEDINPSARELIKKIVRIGLVSLAFLFALNATGIDLTALAVFGGALGVGIGFGLQKVVGNFISGVILLLDRSIKPGDVIETQGTYGWINRLAARYTSVITRDGTEFLIPNEDMITQPVTNWTHSHTRVRRKIPIQVDYSTDLDKAIEIMNEAAEGHVRVLKNPGPRTLVKAFGSDGVDLELRMWIQDPQNGVSNVASDVMLHIWRRFHEEDIEFPFPQRVIHFASADDEASVRERIADKITTPGHTPASPPEEQPELSDIAEEARQRRGMDGDDDGDD